MTRAVVIGGGVAGMSAAFGLRDAGLDVELYEAHGGLGGRAFSLPHRLGVDRIDNGPHVMLGCYDAMRRLLRRVGSEQLFEQPRALRLAFVDNEGARSHLVLSHLPAPVALPNAVLRLAGLGVRDRLRALWGMTRSSFGARAGLTLAEWLTAQRQNGGPRSYLWDPLCRAIMNAEAEDVAAADFLRTLRRAFFGSAARAAIWVPRRPWGEILDVPGRAALERAGVAVHLRARVQRLIGRDDRVVALEVDGARRDLDADTMVVAAVPWHVAAKLLPPDSVPGAATMRGSPIVSVYFDLPEAEGLPEDPVVALVDGDPFHFFCRRRDALWSSFALLSGGRRDFDGMSVQAIERVAREQLARHFPAATGLLEGGQARVVKENRATFIAAPGTAAQRPRPGRLAPWQNLQVCGDWTATDLPATLEGGALSGEMLVAGLR